MSSTAAAFSPLALRHARTPHGCAQTVFGLDRELRLLGDFAKEQLELGGARQREAHAADFAQQLERELDHGADQHECLATLAEERQRVANAAQRDRIAERSLGVEQSE
jgi:hypothetical protein